MWTRSELKDQAKFNLRGKYWMAFLVSVIVSLLGAGSSMFSWRFNLNDFRFDELEWSRFQSGDFQEYLDLVRRYFDSGIVLLALVIGFFAFLVAIGYQVFVSSVVQVGGNRWFSRNREAAATPMIGQIFSLFKAGSYLRTVGGMFWMNLFLFLWSLLPLAGTLIIAGILFTNTIDLGALREMADNLNNPDVFLENWIDLMRQILPAGLLTAGASILLSIPLYIKTYSYRMTPWILADNPQIGYKRALKLSMDLTRGHKLNMWVLDLSFIGWLILGILACGIGVLFVMPYYYAVQAELFARLRQNCVSSGLCTMEDFGYVKVEMAAQGSEQRFVN